MYCSGVSGRGIGKIFGMSKANVCNWIKKMKPIAKNLYKILEMDELYWFVYRKPRTKRRENVYVTTLVSQLPRQIVGFDVAFDKVPGRIQKNADNALRAEIYATDGFLGYLDIVYPGQYIRNISDKSDAFTVDGINADLRHHISLLARRSRCFARKPETLPFVVAVFVEAYNRFGLAKQHFYKYRPNGEPPFGLVDFL